MTERDTRHKILLFIQRNHPISAADISEEFGISPVGVRRHLDAAEESGLVTTVHRNDSQRGRGRPTKYYQLTESGRSQFGHDYDGLAMSALKALQDAGGQSAIDAFAHQRAQDILQGPEEEEHLEPGSISADEEIHHRAENIAEALNEHGYAAEAVSIPGGIQLCRHHCPVQQVAHEFPELCQAEHDRLGELLGQHTLPLATIADGNGICTTHIPLNTIHSADDTQTKDSVHD